jgi:predicted MFS family arabinose efflux permease
LVYIEDMLTRAPSLAQEQFRLRARPSTPRASGAGGSIAALLPIMGVVFIAFLIIGVEAVRRAPPQNHGLAMGAYTVFLDVALGFGSPALGLFAGWAGLSAVFVVSAVIVACAALIALRLLVSPAPEKDAS